MIVLDASAAVDFLLGRAASAALDERIVRERGAIFAPHLVDIEIMHVLRRFEKLGVIDAARAGLALSDWAALGVRRLPHDVLVARIWELRRNATPYDAAYLALAEALDAKLVTTDRKLARVPGSRAIVDVLA